ncbi:MAG: aldo/keto reductase [Phycisphaerales bacterium]
MIHRRFGRTELQMPVFSCGGMRYQQGWQDMPLSDIQPDQQKNLEATIARSLELGVNHIETARGYGSSERQLGPILSQIPRDQIIVQTKIAPDPDPRKFEDNFKDSLERLRLDHVDLLAIHGINNDETLDWSCKPGGCFDIAQKLRDQKLCNFIGFSTHGPTDIIVKAIHHGQPKTGLGFDYVNLHWYYIFQRNWPAVEAATRRDMGVFIISPSDKGGKLYDPPAKLVELTQPLHPITFNDLFCLYHEQIHTLSIGAARPSDFDQHIDTLKYMPNAHDVLAPILDRLDRALADAVEPELYDPFHLGLPEPDQTPGGINIPLILWLRTLAKAFGMTDYGKMRYNMLGNGGHWFPGKPAADFDEQALSKVLAGSPLADRIPAMLKETHAMLKGEERKRLQKE